MSKGSKRLGAFADFCQRIFLFPPHLSPPQHRIAVRVPRNVKIGMDRLGVGIDISAESARPLCGNGERAFARLRRVYAVGAILIRSSRVGAG